MASKKSKAKGKAPKRYYPVQLSARLSDFTAASANIRLIEYDRILGPINRRQYRQSRVPSLKIDVDQGSGLAQAGVKVYCLRNTWDMHGAYRFAMEQYYNAMKEELDMAAGSRGRWLDFRVQANIGADLLCPRVEDQPTSPAGSFTPNRLTTGDFTYSSVYDASGVQKVFVTSDTASSATEWSIFEEWSRKDQVQESPAGASQTMPYRDIQEDTDENNYDLMRNIGDAPPYSAVSENDMWMQVAEIGETAAGVQKLTTGFFEAPLGIVVLVSAGFTAGQEQNHPLTLTCQKGDYKGIKAPAYATPVLTEDMTYKVV